MNANLIQQRQQFLQSMEQFYQPSLVKINDDAIKNDVAIREAQATSDPAPAHLQSEKDVLAFFLVLNSINHQFWSLGENNSMVRYSHNGKVGAMALHAGMNRLSQERGLDPQTITVEDVQEYFGNMPNPEQRAQMLTQAFQEAKTLASELLATAPEGWSILEASSIAARIPLGYADDMLKKAQLCLYMGSTALQAMNGKTIDCALTSFADYQVPRVQRHRGWLEYSPELAEKIKNQELIPSGSVEEKAIRAASMLACAKAEEYHGVSQAAQDYWLWQQRNSASDPFHMTISNDY
jgi:hypothetical protein